MRTLISLFSALAVAASLAGAAHSQDVRILGRSEPIADGFVIQWPGSGFETQMRGSRLTARIEDWGSNVLNVEVDGEVSQIHLHEGVLDYVLFDGPTGNHTIKVTRRTGTPTGPTSFLDVSSDGSLMPTYAPFRRMMVIGDSIASGYGIEGENQYCTYSYATHNHDLAYPALIAKAFNADLHTIAADGGGLIRSFDGEGVPMQDLAWLEIPENDRDWVRQAYRPQVIVINLGAADFAAGDPGDAFDAAYVALLTELRQTYPQATIYGAIGGMLHGQAYKAARDSVLGAVTKRRAAGDNLVHFIEFSLKDAPRRFGCDWHPGIDAHRQMADALEMAIALDLGWKANPPSQGLVSTR